MKQNKIAFERAALDDLKVLNPKDGKRIIKKLKWYSEQKNPLKFATKLSAPMIGSFRFRIGDYRAIFDIEDETIIFLRIGHRSNIYK